MKTYTVDTDGNKTLVSQTFVLDGDKGEPGKDGDTPRIVDGMWWIGDTNTNIPATGENGKDGSPGQDGITPTIGDNGNWFIGCLLYTSDAADE